MSTTLFPWAVPFVNTIMKADLGLEIPQDEVVRQLTQDGLYLSNDNSQLLIEELQQAGFLLKMDPEAGTGHFTDQGVPRGLAYGISDEEPDCTVWWFYNELPS